MKRKQIIVLIGIITFATITSGLVIGLRDKVESIPDLIEQAYEYLYEGNYDEAIIHFENILIVEPNHLEARIGLAEAYSANGQYEDAINIVEEGLIFNQSESLLWDMLIGLTQSAGYNESEMIEVKERAYVATNIQKYSQVRAVSTVDVATEEEVTSDSGPSYIIELEAPEKQIEFVDGGFEAMIRAQYKLGDGAIYWKDIGYQEELSIWPDYIISDLEDLKWFVNLKTLNGISQGVGGDISSIASLTQLQSVLLWGIELSGDLESIAGMTSLNELNLSGANKVTGDLSSISGLTNLTRLQLGYSMISGDIADIAHLSSLIHIEMNKTNVHGDISALGGMPELSIVSMGETHVSGNLVSLSGLDNLTYVDFEDANVQGDKDSLSHIVTLETIIF